MPGLDAEPTQTVESTQPVVSTQSVESSRSEKPPSFPNPDSSLSTGLYTKQDDFQPEIEDQRLVSREKEQAKEEELRIKEEELKKKAEERRLRRNELSRGYKRKKRQEELRKKAEAQMIEEKKKLPPFSEPERSINDMLKPTAEVSQTGGNLLGDKSDAKLSDPEPDASSNSKQSTKDSLEPPSKKRQIANILQYSLSVKQPGTAVSFSTLSPEEEERRLRKNAYAREYYKKKRDGKAANNTVPKHENEELPLSLVLGLGKDAGPSLNEGSLSSKLKSNETTEKVDRAHSPVVTAAYVEEINNMVDIEGMGELDHWYRSAAGIEPEKCQLQTDQETVDGKRNARRRLLLWANSKKAAQKAGKNKSSFIRKSRVQGAQTQIEGSSAGNPLSQDALFQDPFGLGYFIQGDDDQDKNTQFQAPGSTTTVHENPLAQEYPIQRLPSQEPVSAEISPNHKTLLQKSSVQGPITEGPRIQSPTRYEIVGSMDPVDPFDEYFALRPSPEPLIKESLFKDPSEFPSNNRVRRSEERRTKNEKAKEKHTDQRGLKISGGPRSAERNPIKPPRDRREGFAGVIIAEPAEAQDVAQQYKEPYNVGVAGTPGSYVQTYNTWIFSAASNTDTPRIAAVARGRPEQVNDVGMSVANGEKNTNSNTNDARAEDAAANALWGLKWGPTETGGEVPMEAPPIEQAEFGILSGRWWEALQ